MNNDNIIGRCVSRKTAVHVLEDCLEYIPPLYLRMYVAALNRTRFELQKRIPVKPVRGCCGNCGERVEPDWVFCANCGREILRYETD